MNKVGLVDFWCYENEVFEFENGHMLLRGSNGSGKSVTMQSVIPLLLDGNKSSERLDAFGTKSRRMETYLIDENSERDNRVGYLYLEFKREDSDIYKTIGMGLHARKGKPLKSWYFVIEDNRRVNVDFSLIDNHLTLSEKQLKNILGDQVISTQREYMKRVNDALFGFESLDDYKDAIDLLIQLRSPKLSNSLSPQKINEILGNSLQPLSDEDLRPMSEAIVNMDNLQDQLESLKQSLTAAKTLEQAYQNYNKVLLVEKWNKYIREHQEYQKVNQFMKQVMNEKQEKQTQMDVFKQQFHDNRIEYEVKKNELLSLKNSDMDQWVETIHQLDQDIHEYDQEIHKKSINYEQKDNQCQSSKQHIDQWQNQIDDKEYQCQKFLREMNILNENLSLSEHIALTQCFTEQKNDFEFAYTRSSLQEALKKAEEGIQEWHAYDQQKQKIDFYEDQKSQCQLKLDQTLYALQHAEESYHQKVEEYLENYHQYNETNRILKLSTQDMEDIRMALIQYEETKDYFRIKDIVENVYQHLLTEFTHQKIDIMNNMKIVEEELDQLYKEKDHWVNMEDPQPEKTNESKQNRMFLDEHGIQYIPLYKLLNFAEDVQEEEKQRIEELFMEMKLLDALVVYIDDKSFVQDAPSGCQDHYLWTSQALSTLQPVSIQQLSSQEHLLDLLSKLGIKGQYNIEITKKYYQSGIIEGSLALNKEAVYIGFERRLKMKENMIQHYSEQIAKQENIYQEYNEKCQNYDKKLEILKKEYKDCLSEKELKEAFEQVITLRKDHMFLQQQLERLVQELLNENKKIEKIYNHLQVLASQMMLPVQKNAFIEYKNDLSEYQNYFEKFKDEYLGMIRLKELKEFENDKLLVMIEERDELHYEKEKLVQKRTITVQKKETLEKQLEAAGYSDLTIKIQNIQKRLDDLEKEYFILNKDLGGLESDIKHLESEIHNYEQQSQQQAKRRDIYKDILTQEVNHHFVFKDEYSEKELLKALKELAQQMSMKKSISEYQNQLQRVYFEQNIYLAQYNVVQENSTLCHQVEDLQDRLILKATNQGKKISFLQLMEILTHNIEMQEMLIMEEDRHIFEEILVNTIGKKMRERIQISRRWVETMQSYMDDMNTSSGLQLSLKWKSRKAIDDQQMDTQKLVELLEKDYRVLKESDRQKISNHFRSKIATARKMSQDENTTASFHQLMKNVMDYRQWFDFTLYAKKPNENRKELTSHVFYAYSGGEKALSMYVPLFSAVAAKFAAAREDAPLLIALDEAFAGVDENNIDNMFALIHKFKFDYIMNSQVLWGDYPSCPSLAIYELFRPNNAPFVSVISYLWNGHQKRVKFS